MSRFVSVKKNQRQDIIISVNFDQVLAWPKMWLIALSHCLFNFIIGLFQFLELIYQKKFLLGLAGLGLGFGFSIIVGQRPSSSLATDSVEYQPISIAEISLPHYFVSESVTAVDRLKPVCLVGGAQLLSGSLLEASQPMIIAGCTDEPVFSKLEQLNLGDEIVVLGSNRGRYHFHIVEIREIKADGLNTFSQLTNSGLILYTPTDLLSTRFLVVVARPF